MGAKERAHEDRYQLLRTILSTGRLGTAFGASVGWMVSHSELPSSNNMFRPTIVCFCDIPLEHLAIHMKKYSRFGIAYSKTFLLRQAANPVFCIARDSFVPHLHDFRAQTFDAMTPKLLKLVDAYTEGLPEAERGDARWFGRFSLQFSLFNMIKWFDAALPDDSSGELLLRARVASTWCRCVQAGG